MREKLMTDIMMLLIGNGVDADALKSRLIIILDKLGIISGTGPERIRYFWQTEHRITGCAPTELKSWQRRWQSGEE